jgi:hypothetical protein
VHFTLCKNRRKGITSMVTRRCWIAARNWHLVVPCTIAAASPQQQSTIQTAVLPASGLQRPCMCSCWTLGGGTSLRVCDGILKG